MRFVSVAAAAAVAVAMALLGQPALAKDPIGARAMAMAPASWTGFYFGGDLGVALGSQTYSFTDLGGAAWNTCGPCGNYYDTVSLSGGQKSGLLGGAHIGYDWQFAPRWLLGAEGDFTWTGLDRSVSAALSENPSYPVVNANGLAFETKVKWLASLRGRVGWLANPASLIYATGGIAWADVEENADAVCPTGVGLCHFTTDLTGAPLSISKTRTGFVLGGGAEWEFAAHWRGRAEYLYYGFNGTDGGTSPFLATGGGPVACTAVPGNCNAQYTFGNLYIHTFRLGFSYTY